MKIKSDFITNSSSSSFIAWGVEIDEIKFSDEMLLTGFENKITTLRRQLDDDKVGFSREYYSNKLIEMSACETSEEKIEYMKNLSFDYKLSAMNISSEFEYCDKEYTRAVGFPKEAFMSSHPEIKIKDIESTVAKELNDIFGTNFIAKDICSYEEIWYDG